MSMMECAHCRRAVDARSMSACDGCNSMICQDCSGAMIECPGDSADYDQ